jgi:isopenicillin N synthase-like dioxygenase
MERLNPKTDLFLHIPVIDIQPLIRETGDRPIKQVAEQIGHACRNYGFFYVIGHGVDEGLQHRLEHLSRQFFAQDLETKQQIRMELGGRAWRGYFPVGGELTSGKPDWKEGIYFGSELASDHPLVQAGVPMHGANLFPALPQFRETVLAYLDAMANLGHALMAGIAMSLDLDDRYFRDRYTFDPLILFRIFNYPFNPAIQENQLWGVGEHTDYGLLTILKQDDCSGLQIKSNSQWIDAPPIPNSFVCNIGDMLDRMTGGLYRSTPHRVQNTAGRDRLSFPFFFDPNFNAEVQPIELPQSQKFQLLEFYDDKHERWDNTSVHEFRGTYGDYVLNKVSKVFPMLRQSVL